ncbi:MAG: YihY/virulence factor BrkB family protein [Gammaproteobacteria bacterium]|nr:YihY/virulence factor BrkB family protein [Gammaproteobacteria bacterium]MBT8150959.1 YihY/virulence factor BrkB family protein [Gammaproteobacteria bacterium]NND38306.1 YihY/virulence factor BrkB family protein [Pseudomonadales bacterium]NNM11466.1 YihY/virulence factor BrkB family protein [Pseudomonadales bacterium]RZV58203.1 MAG: YihY/virulence factor BrkB family protein [Pseudomonadales bacterium]
MIDEWRKKTDEFNAWLWSERAERGNVVKRGAIAALRIVLAVWRDLRDGHVSMRAMSLVYTTVIAIVPMIALVFSVLKGFGLHNRVKPALLEALIDLGDKRFEIVDKIMEFIDNVNVGVLGSVGFAILLYSVVSMMHKIEAAFNYTWQISRSRDLSHRLRDYLSVVFVGPLLIFLSAAITTSMHASEIARTVSAMPMGDQLMALLGYALPYLIMAAGFAFIYAFLPNTRVRLGSAFIGGLVTAVIWKIMGWGIATFVANSANQIAIYSAFASIIILMVWLYLGWLVLLVGASITFYHQCPEYLRVQQQHKQLSFENAEKLALSIMCMVADRFEKTNEPWCARAISSELKLPPYLVDDCIDTLVEAGYLVRSSEQDQLYPASPLDRLEVVTLLQSVRRTGSYEKDNQQLSFDARVDALLEKMESSRVRECAGATIASLRSE